MNAILLQRGVGRGAIGTTAPLALELLPLLGGEVVVGSIDPTFAASCGARASSLSYSHTAKLVHRTPPFRLKPWMVFFPVET